MVTSKQEIVYSSILTNLKQTAIRKNKEFSPKNIHCDFELSLLKAIKISMLKTRLCGCYFHYSQAIYRKFAKEHLKNKIYKGDSISKAYAFMRTMPLLPRDLVQVFLNHIYFELWKKGKIKQIHMEILKSR